MKLQALLNPTLTWRSTFVVVAVGIAALGVTFLLRDPGGHRELRAKLRLGLTESAVIHQLGQQPDYAYERDTAPADYYIKGWSRRERAITHRVLIFMLGEPICYVWLDERGLVEDVYVGGP